MASKKALQGRLSGWYSQVSTKIGRKKNSYEVNTSSSTAHLGSVISSPSSVSLATDGIINPALTLDKSADTSLGTSVRSLEEGGPPDVGVAPVDETQENTERGNWAGKPDFFLVLLGYAVGVGNVWRFPYLCFINGGAAFLIPYTIVLVVIGIPIFYMELLLGQFTSCGPLSCWEFAPIFKGIGVAQLIVSAEVAIYYNMLIAWCVYYVISSLVNAGNLPFANCDHYWNTPFCWNNMPNTECNETLYNRLPNGTCYNGSEFLGVWNQTAFGHKRPTASNEYYNNRVLRLSTGLDDVGPAEWDLSLVLLLAWVITFLCMMNSIKSIGKVVYVTAPLPYLILVILFLRGISLSHASDGLILFLQPDISLLSKAQVWSDAAVQMFFAICNCWGGLATLSSYNKFNYNCHRDAIIITIINYISGIFAGLVIFSFLGHMAYEMGVPVADVVDQGPGLAFITYPDAVVRTSASPLWSILFFIVLLMLGLDTQFATLETVLTALYDQFKWLRPYKTRSTMLYCVILFLLGLPLCTPMGSYLLNLMNTFCSGWNLLFIGLVETIAVAWVYGVRRFEKDITIMLGKPSLIHWWWKLCWVVLSPLFLAFVLLFQWVQYTTPMLYDYAYPGWSQALGWLMSISSVIFIPITAIVLLCRDKTKGSLWQRLKSLSRPTIYWGPALIRHRKLVDYVEGFVVDPWGRQQHAMPTSPTSVTLSGSDASIHNGELNTSCSVVSLSNMESPKEKESQNISDIIAQSHEAEEKTISGPANLNDSPV